MRFPRLLVLVVASLGLFAVTAPASLAATSTAAMAVSAFVVPVCLIDAGAQSADRYEAPRAQVASTVTCSLTVPFTVTHETDSPFPTSSREEDGAVTTVIY